MVFCHFLFFFFFFVVVVFFIPGFSHINNNNIDNATNRLSSSSSEEDNSPTQMNNCRKFIDKAPLVKRLSNSLLRSGHDEYRPLLNDNNFSGTSNYLSASSAQIASKLDNANDDTLIDTNDLIASKFGDSCRKSLTSVLLDNRRSTKDYCEFDFKQHFLRETSSGKYHYSPLICIQKKKFLSQTLPYIQITLIKMANHCWILIHTLTHFKCFFFSSICSCSISFDVVAAVWAVARDRSMLTRFHDYNVD